MKMANDARENYRSVFGVYPNEPKQSHSGPTEAQRALGYAFNLESAANDLNAYWEKSQFSGASDHSRALLQQIKAAVVSLREEIGKTNSQDSSH